MINQRIRFVAMRAHAWLMAIPRQAVLVAAIAIALNLASNLSNSFGDSPHFGGPVVAWGTFLAFVAAFALAMLASRSSPRDPLPARGWKPWFIYALAAWTLFTGAQSLRVIAAMPRYLSSPSHYGSDEMYFAHYNAWLLLHGQNPYAGERLPDALRYFDTEHITPLRVGAFSDPLHPPTDAETQAIVAAYLANPAAPHPQIEPATTPSYPSLSFLIAVPSVWLGLPTLGYAQVVALMALIATLVALSPPRWRWLVLALCLLDVDGIRSVANSDFQIWTAVGVAAVWLVAVAPGTREKSRIDRSMIAAVLLGLVCAIQQTAWFAAPFYLTYVLRSRGWRAALRDGLIAVAAFLAINLPWLITTPREWLRSLFLPVSLPLFPTGGGLVGLGLGEALPLFAPLVYSILEIAAFMGLLWAYWRWWRLIPLVGLVLPSAAILLAWRSPSRYFILLPILAIVALVLAWCTAEPETEEEA